MTKVRATLDYLRRCQQARALGYPVSYTTDPAWLLHMAISRRGGEPDMGGFTRGIGRRNHRGRIARKTCDDWFRDTQNMARAVNTPRLIVRSTNIPLEWRETLQHRLTWPRDEAY